MDFLSTELLEKILKMTQTELKEYLKTYIKDKGYVPVDECGFLYAKGSVPVLLIAHLDRFPQHEILLKEYSKRYNCKYERAETIVKKQDDNIWSSPMEGICGDDRCGVWAILNLIENAHPSILFTEDEEIGKYCITGAMKFAATEYVKKLDVNYMIQIDRKGKSDIVFYTCDNPDFKKWLEENTDFRTAISNGKTDIVHIMPVSGIAGVNFSCGYYNEHHSKEEIHISELKHTTETIARLIPIKIEEYFKYIEQKS